MGLIKSRGTFPWKNNEGKQSLHELIDREERGARWICEQEKLEGKKINTQPSYSMARDGGNKREKKGAEHQGDTMKSWKFFISRYLITTVSVSVSGL